jgi:Carboxypeptidase regulatory-like domain
MRLGLQSSALNSLLRLWLIFVAAAVAAQSPAKVASFAYSITGTVVNSGTGAPVAHCHITASHMDRGGNANRRGGSQQSATDTDERGHFVLTLASGGNWALRASARGYRSQALDEHQGFTTEVVLTERAPTFDVLFRLAPDSAITGVILDEGSEPVRQSQISVFSVPRPEAGGVQPPAMRTGAAMTDDRGRYEASGLAPGDYRISVQARPWYAAGAMQGRPQGQDVPQLDPSLDVVYPLTWFPGAVDEHSAGIVTLHDGETREADIQLVPIPSVHLQVAGQPPVVVRAEAGGVRVNQGVRFPQVEPVSGRGNFGPISASMGSNGTIEFSGLAPGLYRVRTPDENGQPGSGSVTMLEVTANSSRYLDLASAALPTATVTLKIEGSQGAESLPIVFTDVNDRENVFRSNAGGGFQGGGMGGVMGGTPPQVQRLQGAPGPQVLQQQGGQRPQRGGSGSDGPRRERPPRTIELPPGRYSVSQEGSSNFSLTGLALGTNEIVGRIVTIPSGQSTLTIRFAAGRASLSGVATLRDKPLVGGLAMLVPITVDQPGSITEVRRDQTNTDGSFDISAIIPGQYILIAIDHGWNINWSDPSTLNHYLSNGVPLDLRTPTSVKQNIEAQLP